MCATKWGRGRSFKNRSFEFLSKTGQQMDSLFQPNLLEDTTHSVFHHLTPPVGEPVQIFERTVFERTTYPDQVPHSTHIHVMQLLQFCTEILQISI